MGMSPGTGTDGTPTVDETVDRAYGGTMDDEDIRSEEARPRTAAATEARMRAADEKTAEMLRNRGWIVFKHDQADPIADGTIGRQLKDLIDRGMTLYALQVAHFAGYLSGAKTADRVHEHNERWKAPTLPVELPGKTDPGSPGTYRWYRGARVALVCQVSDAGPYSVGHLPCRYRESGGFQCERIDMHDDQHIIGTHTIEHAKVGNGYACSVIGWFQSFSSSDPFADLGDGTDAGHRPGCSCLSVDIPCNPPESGLKVIKP